MDFFSSIKEENRLVSKGMSNIYFKATIAKNLRSQNFDFLSLKNSSPGQFLGSFQLKQILLNFKTSYYNLKIRGHRSKVCVAFLLF